MHEGGRGSWGSLLSKAKRGPVQEGEQVEPTSRVRRASKWADGSNSSPLQGIRAQVG